MKKKLLAVIAAVVSAAAAMMLVLTLAFMSIFATGDEAAAATCMPAGAPEPTTPPDVMNEVTGGFGQWNATQVGHAAMIVSVGKQKNVSVRGQVIAVATAMQESTLHNYGNLGARNDHDSVGLFQQRPASGWGTVKELTTPAIAAKKFYNALLDVKGWQGMSLTVAAQSVQRSAFPSAYAKWEDKAEALVAHVSGLKSVGDVAGGPPGAECIIKPVADLTTPGPVAGPSGWVNPVKASVGSPFGNNRGDHIHAGVDLIAPRHTPIRAATAGKVTRLRCNSSSGTCDRDGSPSVVGCGWYIEIRSAGNIVTRYCHMVSKPKVRVGQSVVAGQLVGNVGSSGGSSGPHLHYELHQNVPKGENATSGNATDPVKFHKKIGVPLGRK